MNDHHDHESKEQGVSKLAPGMSVIDDIWDDQDDSWESLADRTISMLGMTRTTSCQNEDDVPEMEDDRNRKEDDPGTSKDDMGQDGSMVTPTGAKIGVHHQTPTPGGSGDQDCHGPDTHLMVEGGGTIVPDTARYEDGSVTDRQRGQPTAGQRSVSQLNHLSDGKSFDDIYGCEEEDVPEKPPCAKGRCLTVTRIRGKTDGFATSTPVPSNDIISHWGTDKIYHNIVNNDLDLADDDLEDTPAGARALVTSPTPIPPLCQERIMLEEGLTTLSSPSAAKGKQERLGGAVGRSQVSRRKDEYLYLQKGGKVSPTRCCGDKEVETCLED